MPDNRYMQWPLNPNQGDIFTSESGNTWIFDGCGWVSTCCPPVVICDPEISGISVIYSQKKEGTIFGYGVSYFTWNSNLNRYEGFIQEPMVIGWTGTEWRFALSESEITVATSATSNILEAVFTGTNPEWNSQFGIAQIECGLIYNQLCLNTTYQGFLPAGISEIGPYTLYPNQYDSILDIINGVQAPAYVGLDSSGNDVELYYDSVDLVWYMYENNSYYSSEWEIDAAPNQNALILGSEWLSTNGEAAATFTQGECATECYPNRDGITLMYNDGKWNPIYLTWDPGNQYYFTDNQYINELFGWYYVHVEYDSPKDIIKIIIDEGNGPQSIGGNAYNGSFKQRLFNHAWSGGFDVYCGDVGCSRMCATFNGSTTTMVPWGYSSLGDLIDCTNKFNGWVGWNGTDETIYLTWDGGGPTYLLSIDGNANQNIGVDSYTSAALIANSPYAYDQGGLSGTLALTSGDC